jgi:hypothetical protein
MGRALDRDTLAAIGIDWACNPLRWEERAGDLTPAQKGETP